MKTGPTLLKFSVLWLFPISIKFQYLQVQILEARKLNDLNGKVETMLTKSNKQKKDY